MKTEYRRDLQHSYLVVHVEEQRDEQVYELKMITQNHIPGLLACECRRIDDEILYYYDLTSRISLAEKCSARKMTGEEIVMVVYRLQQILVQMEEYLLSGDSLYLKPEQIYLDAQMKEVSFCYVPGETWSLEEQFRELMEGLLPFLDHQNQETVMAVYGLYHYAVQEHFSVDGLRKQLEQHSRRKMLKERQVDNEWNGEENAHEDRKMQSVERKRHEEALNAFFQDEEEEKQGHPVAVTIGTMAVLGYILSGWFLWRNFPAYMWIWAGCGILFGMAMILWFRKQNNKFSDREGDKNDRFENSVSRRDISDRVVSGGAASGGAVSGSIDLKSRESEQNRTISKNHDRQLWQWTNSDPSNIIQDETALLSESNFETQLLSEETSGYVLEEKCPEQGRRVPLGTNEIQLIGSLKGTADLLLSSPAVSRLHARIRRSGGRYYLCDLNSKNGTRVNQKELQGEQEVELEVGDEIKFADMIYVFLSL